MPKNHTAGAAATRLTGIIATVSLLAGCGDDGPGAADEGTLTVLAASSLTEAFTTLAAAFEADHDGVHVELTFGSSTDLAESAADGAPGDVLATADETSMQVAVDDGVTAADPQPFATNEMVLVTAPGNPAHVMALDDLAGLTWVRCADDVPCGRAALTLLDRARVTAEPASLEPDARSTLEKVSSGEADAAIVYASDATAAGDHVSTVPIAGAEESLATYVVAPLDQAEHPDLADAWMELVTSTTGRRVLRDAGFGPP